jgi:hypothetical protein
MIILHQRVLLRGSCACRAFDPNGDQEEWYAPQSGRDLTAAGLDTAPAFPACRERSIRASVAA